MHVYFDVFFDIGTLIFKLQYEMLNDVQVETLVDK